MKPQLKELVSSTTRIDVLWFDGEWVPTGATEQDGKELYDYVCAA